MEFVFSIFKLKNWLFQWYFSNIWQSLNGCFHEDSENKTATVFSLIFAGFYCSHGDIRRLQGENMRTINFNLKWNSQWKKFWIKESTWIFLTTLCHYHLSEDIKILCMHYQNKSQQYTEEKKTFLRCEDLRVSWDLKQFCQPGHMLEIYLFSRWFSTSVCL